MSSKVIDFLLRVTSGGGGGGSKPVVPAEPSEYLTADELVETDYFGDVKLPDTVKHIRNYMFYHNSSYNMDKGITSISGKKVTSIGDSAFFECRRLVSVDLPAVTFIEGNAFKSCSGLTSADLPAVTFIGSYAFFECSGLTSADLPAVTFIEGNAFKSCSNLETLFIGRDNEEVCTLSGALGSGLNNLKKIYVPVDLADAYKSATNWSQYADKIEGFSSH